ncbi:30S ribosomal protein S6 [Elizabethkingia argentiflava]|uniref:30S ribosomal protein S6 n=1 Tax=Elizabethkingia argenteiflava TaxID=2681556 RepID=A0A845Q139_9FLAO|nr:GYDIA family GHMP kinase [Elizabethkingia argenteiflava]NAW52040.1 30S ribosomal protein S6 [Elizabethkingia argenteiflava]
MEKQYFFSPGKLLLTSEYFALDGAKALAIPTRLGQELSAESIEDGRSYIYWETYREGRPWLKAWIDYANMKVLETNRDNASEFILKIFHFLKYLASKKLITDTSYRLISHIEFPENFGWGSSSTLINNLSKWAEVDAFVLNDLTLGGSGYDIGVAQEATPILYTRTANEKIVEKISYAPRFKNELLFVHLNRKQDSREGINMYRSKDRSSDLISYFSNLTDQILKENTDLEKFSFLMQKHEEKMSQFLNIPPIKEKFFKNAPSFFKSLGAWGGDFVLTTKFRDYESYFFDNGYPVFFSYRDIISS